MPDLQESLAEHLEGVQWHGDYFSALCPFPHNGHKEINASLLVYPDGFVCMGASCGKRGSLKYLLAYISKNVSLTTSVKVSTPVLLPRWRRWGFKYGDVQEIAEAGHKYLKSFKGHQVFFKRRKIDQFIEEGMFGYLEGWLLFPVLDKDRNVIDIVVRASKTQGVKYVVKPDKARTSPNIYVPNWERVLKADTVYIPYGIIDAWALEAIGLPAITGTTGKSLSAFHIKELHKRIILIPDQYEEKSAYALAKDLGLFSKVKIIKWPENTKDPDDIRRNLGDAVLRSLVLS